MHMFYFFIVLIKSFIRNHSKQKVFGGLNGKRKRLNDIKITVDWMVH